MKNKRMWVSVVVGLLVVGVLAWVGLRQRDRQQVETVKELGRAAMQAAGDQRSQAWEQFRTASEQLSESQQQALRQDMRGDFMASQMREIDEFYALDTPAERNAFLDERIREMEDRRKEWERRRQQREASDGQNGGDRGQAGGGGGGPRGGGGPGGPGGGRGGNRDERIARIYDNTTPDQRAKYTGYREAMQRRRDELGLPQMQWGRGRPPR